MIVLSNKAKAMRMEEQHSGISITVTHSLERAALLPQRRDELISHALEQLLTSLAAVGIALIWPRRDRVIPWKVYYVGSKRAAIQRWLSERLEPSVDATLKILQHDLTHSLTEMPPPLLLPLYSLSSSPSAVWILWVPPKAEPSFQDVLRETIEEVRQTLEAMLEVEEREAAFFTSSSPLYDRDLIEALAHGDPHALSTFLSLTRVVAGADFTFWGRAYQDVIEVTDHLGARHNGFGFSLPRGQGVGGRVIVYGEPIALTDYRNSPYRHPSISDIIDSEEIRTGMALPVRAIETLDRQGPVAAVLYATRRTVRPFTQADRLLAQRQANLIESLSLGVRPTAFSMSVVQQLPDYKAKWHDLVLHANHIEAVEAWATQVIKGVVIITDSEHRPYVLAHSERLERIRASQSSQPNSVQVLSLAVPGLRQPGLVYLCSSITLPPAQWPDFFADLVVACNAVITRMERAHDQWDRQRERWARALLQEESSLSSLEQEGYRLGLPVAHGKLWVVVWPIGTTQSATTSIRKRMIIENVILDHVKSPPIFLDDDIALILLDEQTPQNPSKLRDALLTHCHVHPIWIVQGGHYRSLNSLQTMLTHSLSLARKARRDNHTEYLLGIFDFGLDSLLENPRLAQDLESFAQRLLTPLLEYDAANSSRLTETFVLAQTLGSAQAVAEQLGVHVNTIRYRLRRAEDILGMDQTSPKEQAALTLAAFTWQHFRRIFP